jgi:hypothetical protein
VAALSAGAELIETDWGFLMDIALMQYTMWAKARVRRGTTIARGEVRRKPRRTECGRG